MQSATGPAKARTYRRSRPRSWCRRRAHTDRRERRPLVTAHLGDGAVTGVTSRHDSSQRAFCGLFCVRTVRSGCNATCNVTCRYKLLNHRSGDGERALTDCLVLAAQVFPPSPERMSFPARPRPWNEIRAAICGKRAGVRARRRGRCSSCGRSFGGLRGIVLQQLLEAAC
jgi:hypothetical protein